MRGDITRRRFAVLAGSILAGGLLAPAGPLWAGPGARGDLTHKLVDIEARLKARLGVSILDTHTGRRWKHRAGERFAMCSTFKAIACAAVLARVDAGREDLNRRIPVDPAKLVAYSPVTKKRAGGPAMTLAEICRAAITQSDNTAANMILDAIGGPAGFTAFARSIGDAVTRLDRWETALNEAKPGDPRDTTTPDAMAADLRLLLLGDHLSARSRAQLIAWLVANQTGGARLRAGLPANWRVGDKTGGGDHGTANDIGIIWPPDRKPVIACVYLTETEAGAHDRNAAIADVARGLHEALGA